MSSRSRTRTPADHGLAMRQLLIILGVPIDDLDMDEALDRIEFFVDHGRRTGKCHQIATVNADFVVNAIDDPELRYLLQNVDMATPDGMPLVWGARLLGVPMSGRVTGADLVPALAQRAAQKGYSLFLLGAAPGVAARAAQVMQEFSPDLKIAGVISPPYTSVLEMDPAIVREIEQAAPDILLVAFGSPKQEKWIGMYGREVQVPVMIGVGGTLDFIAGETSRAPRWMQSLGLEWLYRLLQEPRRLWRRYIVDMVGFGSFFLRQWWLLRQRAVPKALVPDADLVIMDQGREGKTAILHLDGRVDVTYAESLRRACERALEETPFIVVNLANVGFLDSTAIGTLVGLAKVAEEQGGQLRLAAVQDNVRQALSLLRLETFFHIDDDIERSLEQQERRVADRVQTEGRWTIFRVPRRLDANTTPQVNEVVSELLETHPYLILDFRQTSFLTSAGLAFLLTVHRAAETAGGALRLAGCSEDVMRVIEMVRFDKVLAIFPTLEAAKERPTHSD